MKIKVMFRPEMVGPSAASAGGSPSAAKPAQVVEHWELLHDDIISVQGFAPVSVEELCTVHRPAYVRGIFAGDIPSGFGTIDERVTRTLPYTSGSMLAAARVALRDGIACSPTSGFHHAGYASAEGFCTFNGLVLAAMSVLEDLGESSRVAILDCDYHYGNGTESSLAFLRVGEKGALAERVIHDTMGLAFNASRGLTRRQRETHAARFLEEWLPKALQRYLEQDVDLVIYQAGADPHMFDPYGGFLTTDDLRKRDEIVFEALANRIPCAWNLAGGYQIEIDGSIPEVLRIHENTLLAAASAFGG